MAHFDSKNKIYAYIPDIDRRTLNDYREQSINTIAYTAFLGVGKLYCFQSCDN